MNYKFIIILGIFLVLKIPIVSAQTGLDDSEESEIMLMLEFVVKEHMIKPINAKIEERYIAENQEGAKIIVIKCNRSRLYSDNFIKQKLHEFTQMRGHFGPESGFGANTEIIRPWQSRNDIEEIDIDTVWLLYEETVLNILLGEEVISFMIFQKYW